MSSLTRSACPAWPPVLSFTRRTAVYGPVRTVVWEGRAGNRSPYPDRDAGIISRNAANQAISTRFHFIAVEEGYEACNRRFAEECSSRKDFSLPD